MKCKDTQKKQYANFYFIFLLFSFRQIFITRPYCHFPTLFLSPSSTPQPFSPSLQPLSYLFSHDPNPLPHCLSPRPPLLSSLTAIAYLPNLHSFALQPLFSPSQPLSFPLKNITAQPFFQSPHSESSFCFLSVPMVLSFCPFFPVFGLPIPAPFCCTIPSLIVRYSFAHQSRPFNSCFA